VLQSPKMITGKLFEIVSKFCQGHVFEDAKYNYECSYVLLLILMAIANKPLDIET
jgi:hypothetical protein